jgi:hypothetical protein
VEGWDAIQKRYIEVVNGPENVTWEVLDSLYGNSYSIKKNVKPGRIKTILQGVTPMEFEITYEQFQPDDKVMDPVNLDLVDDEVKNEILGRVREEGMIGFMMKYPQTLAITLTAAFLTYGDSVLENPFLRMLAYYVNQWDDDPFRELSGGQILVTENDSMASTRCYLLMRAFSVSMGTRYPLDLLMEHVLFLFRTPYRNTLFLKKHTTAVKSCVFCLSKGGMVIAWPGFAEKEQKPTMPRPTPMPVTDNDHVAYEFMKDEFEANILHLREAGLHVQADFWIKMLSADVNEENMSLACFTPTLFYFTGFMSTEFGRSALDQVEQQPPVNEDEVTMTPYLTKLWSDAVAKLDVSRVQTEHNFLAMLPRIMTSRSSGGFKATVISYFTKWVPGSRRVISGPRKGMYEHQSSYTDKIMNFFLDPFAVHDPEFMRYHSVPWKDGVKYQLSSRTVQAKPKRAIFMMPTPAYISQSFLAIGIGDLQARQNKIIVDILDFHNVFTIGTERGSIVSDHTHGIVSSSRSDTLICLTDYTAFDSSERYINTRKAFLDGVEEGFARHGMHRDGDGTPFMTFKSYLDMFLTREELDLVCYFQVKNGEVIPVPGLRSGEFVTLIYNNMVNFANFLSFLLGKWQEDKYIFAREVLRLNKVKFQGDDSWQEWVLIPETYDIEVHKALVESQQINSAHNGLDINPYKTTTRKFFYEYLKKSAIYGWILGRVLQTLIDAAERPNYSLDPISAVMSIVSTSGTCLSRGWNHEFLVWYCHAFFNMKRGVRHASLRDDPTVHWTQLPFASMWVPINLKGAGGLPHTIIFPSKDALCALLAFQPENNAMLEKAASVLNIQFPSPERTMANAYYEGLNTEPANVMQPIKDYFGQYLYRGDLIRSSSAAYKRLRRRGAAEIPERYENFGKMAITKSIESSRAFVRAKYEARTTLGFKYRQKRGTNSQLIKTKFDFLRHIDVSFGEVMDDECPCPVAGMDRVMSDMISKVGFVTNPSPFLSIKTLIERSIPKNSTKSQVSITAEAIITTLSIPFYATSTVNQKDYLMTIGFAPDDAQKLVDRIQANHGLSSLAALNYVSSQGGVTNYLNFSRTAQYNATDVLETGDVLLNGILVSIAYSLFITQGLMTGEYRKVIFRYSDLQRARMLESFRGKRRKYRATAYLGLYPQEYPRYEAQDF